MQGWIIQVHQVLAGEMAAEREYLNQRQLKLGHAPKRWRRILRATERLGRATGTQPSIRQADLSKVLCHPLEHGGGKHHRLLEF